MLPISIFVVLRVLSQAILSSAYSWQLDANPVQCSDLSITVTGTGGQPPYDVLVVPFGASPFPNHAEVRGIVQKKFDGNSNSVTVPINYPANSQFVAVVSDSSGFGTGGTSAPTTVADSGDNSCFNPSHTWTPQFWFYIGNTSQVVQCNTTRIWWNDTAVVKGTPTFLSVVPGGISFQIPESPITNTTDEGIGFSWLPQIREGTSIVVIGGDDRGNGVGGSAQYSVTHSDNSSCVSAGSTSTTPGTVVGTAKTQQNMAPIIGGVIGGLLGFIALCALAAFLFMRHRRHHRETLASSVSSVYATRSSNGLLHYGPAISPFSPDNSITSATALAQNGMASIDDSRISTGTQQFEAASPMTSPPSLPVISTQPTDPENAPTNGISPPAYNTVAGPQQDGQRQEHRTRRGKLIELRPSSFAR